MSEGAVVLLVIGLTLLSGCIIEHPDNLFTACQEGEVGSGDLQVHVYPGAQHLEHSDWDAATEKRATITPFVDNGTNRYVEDEERYPPRTAPLDESDCVIFEDVEPGWWEIRSTARAPSADCTWYGGDGKMVLIEGGKPHTTRFQPTLACS